MTRPTDRDRAAAHLREHHVEFWGGGMQIVTTCPEGQPKHSAPAEWAIMGSENWPHVLGLFRLVLGIDPDQLP